MSALLVCCCHPMGREAGNLQAPRRQTHLLLGVAGVVGTHAATHDALHVCVVCPPSLILILLGEDMGRKTCPDTCMQVQPVQREHGYV